jgi:hypothetical protein
MDILRLAAEANAIVATGHLHASEIMALAEVSDTVGVRVLINHPENPRLDLSPSSIEDLKSTPVMFEHCFNFCTPHLPLLKPEELIDNMVQAGFERSVMATDMGQLDNFSPVEGMRVFIETAGRLGISQADIDLMTKTNPASLLDLPASSKGETG